jgi:hypothetical protein
MKTRVIWAFFLTAFLIGITLSATAQEMSKQDFLDKSKQQKTAAFITLGGGLVLGVLGASMIDSNRRSDFNLFAPTVPKTKDNSEGIWGIVMVTGGLAVLGSIPMFISSNKNAKKAAQLSFRNEPIHMLKHEGNLSRSVPSITLKIPL